MENYDEKIPMKLQFTIEKKDSIAVYHAMELLL